MLLDEFDYQLPPGLVAQVPARLRDESRLLVLGRADGAIAHRAFRDFPSLLNPGDLLVVNESRVIPARLKLVKPRTGGRVEVLLLRRVQDGGWEALVKPSARLKPGTMLERAGEPGRGVLELLSRGDAGKWMVRPVDGAGPELIGETPLPPYIRRDGTEGLGDLDRERYQTVYAATPGSVAAPTAGLHFTPAVLDEVRARGAEVARCILHIGMGTFAPVTGGQVEDHRMEPEAFELSPEAAEAVRRARAQRRRIVAVGTSAVRVLETLADRLDGGERGFAGETSLFISPGFDFRVVGAMLTNFHLPRSTPLILVSALAGLDRIKAAYAEAVREKYRFLSYGDAMFIA